MKVTIENMGVCRKSWTVSVPGDRVRSEYDETLDEFCREARVDGFRPGRAPRSLVERRFGDAVRKEVGERLMREAYQAARREAGAPPMALLDAKASEIVSGENGDWTATFIVEVTPEFDLPPYKGLALSRQSVAVSESDVDRAVNALREGQARFEDVTDRAAEAGDVVRIDFEGCLDGRPLEEAMPDARGLGKATDFWLRIGSESPLPGFAEAHAGVRIGDTRTVESVFPDDFSFAPLRGRTVRYETRVKGLQRPVLPEMSPEWLKQWGVTHADELRARIRESLSERRKTEENSRLRDAALGEVVKKVKMDLPPIELDRTARLWLAEIVNQLVRQGQTEAQIKERAKEIHERAAERAANELRARFVVEKIALAEQIQVGEKEMNEEIAYLALVRRERPEDVRKRLEESGDMENVRRAILQRKVAEFLVANAKVEE